MDRPSSFPSITVNYVSTHTLRTDTQYVNLDDQLSNFWELESIGIKQKCDSVHDKFLEGLTFNGERYEVRLPWKSSYPILPDNYELSLSRLGGTLGRLRQQPEIPCEYDNVIKDQIQKETVEDIPQINQASLVKVHYLPHSGLWHLSINWWCFIAEFSGAAPSRGKEAAASQHHQGGRCCNCAWRQCGEKLLEIGQSRKADHGECWSSAWSCSEGRKTKQTEHGHLEACKEALPIGDTWAYIMQSRGTEYFPSFAKPKGSGKGRTEHLSRS